MSKLMLLVEFMDMKKHSKKIMSFSRELQNNLREVTADNEICHATIQDLQARLGKKKAGFLKRLFSSEDTTQHVSKGSDSPSSKRTPRTPTGSITNNDEPPVRVSGSETHNKKSSRLSSRFMPNFRSSKKEADLMAMADGDEIETSPKKDERVSVSEKSETSSTRESKKDKKKDKKDEQLPSPTSDRVSGKPETASKKEKKDKKGDHAPAVSPKDKKEETVVS